MKTAIIITWIIWLFLFFILKNKERYHKETEEELKEYEQYIHRLAEDALNNPGRIFPQG